MKLRKILLIFSLTTVVLIVAAFFYIHFVVGFPDVDNKLEYFKVVAEVFKVILISFFVGIAVVLLPDVFQERKYEFEAKKEAKRLYTEAKTRIMYLPYTLQFIDDPKQAFTLIEELHKEKHLAETYYEYLPVKNKEADEIQQRIWSKNLQLYGKLNKVSLHIQENIEMWSQMTTKKRYDAISDIFV